jgi:hypothetical protein
MADEIRKALKDACRVAPSERVAANDRQ